MGALRIYKGEGSPDPSRMSLAEAFERHVLPDLTDVADDTLRQYRRAATLWTEFEASRAVKLGSQKQGDTGTIYTGVATIGDQLLAEFARWLVASGKQPSTCNKTWSFLRPIFRKLSPRVEKNPRGLGIIDQVPYFPHQRTPRPKKRIVALDRLDQLYRGAADMTWPPHRDVPPATAWRALLVLLYNFGPRSWSDGASMPMDAIVLKSECPDPDSAVENEHGWLVYEPTKTKRYNRELVLPLNQISRRHFEPLLCDRELLFTFNKANKRFYIEWNRLLELSGVPKFDLKDLRKTCNTAYNKIRPGIGKWFLGHAPHGTNETFYLDVMPQLVDAVHKLPQPPTFEALINKPIERQRRLF
jgi:integrase